MNGYFQNPKPIQAPFQSLFQNQRQKTILDLVNHQSNYFPVGKPNELRFGELVEGL